MINAFSKYVFPSSAMEKVKKIFLGHAQTWLDSENVALSVFPKNNPYTTESLSKYPD